MYPLKDMTLQEVKRAACRPTLWERVVTQPKSCQQLFTRLAPRINNGGKVFVGQALKLLAGGRFLLIFGTSRNGGPSCADLWDLGVPGREDLAPTLLGSFTATGGIGGHSMFAYAWGHGQIFVVLFRVLQQRHRSK